MAVAKKTAKPKLLSGDNPQIAKGYGDGVVQAYIDAVPGWKHDIVRRLDGIIARAAPKVRKAVKWNSPFYGMEDGVWFLSLQCFTNYVRVTFFQGALLEPPPEGRSKYQAVRYLDVRAGALDEAQFRHWVKQAAKLPGERL
ncbi:MAG: DUF1801 domain-containing protein [Alphaproteobacteria bacterium]|nr:DUF1801 domain-containing protein [Alphaproteobacteria bacterium]